MKTVFLVFAANGLVSTFHSDGKSIIGVAHDKEGAITLAKKSGYTLNEQDIVQLRQRGKTVGLEVNIVVEEWQVH